MKWGMIACVAACLVFASGCKDKKKKVTPAAKLVLELHAGTELALTATPGKLVGSQVHSIGLVLPRNDDDSDGDGALDYANSSIDGSDDEGQLAVLTIVKLARAPQPGDLLHIEKKSGSGNVRVFHNSSSILDTGATTQTSSATATALINAAKASDVELLIEGNADGDIELCAHWTGSSNAETCAKLFVRNNYGPLVFSDHDGDGLANSADRSLRTTKRALVFVNSDRDCPVGPASHKDMDDSKIECPADVADIGHLTIDLDRIRGTPTDWKPVLRILASKAGHVRVFEAAGSGKAALTLTSVSSGGNTWQEMDLSGIVSSASPVAHTAVLGIEGREYNKDVEVMHCITADAKDVDAVCDQAHLLTGRVLLQSNIEPVTNVFVANRPTNAAMRADLASLPLPATLVSVASGDVWIQDELEIGGQAAGRGNAQVVIHLPRLRGTSLTPWARALLAPRVGYIDLTLAATAKSAHYGGNLEVSPAGVGHQGHLIVGNNMEAALIAELSALSPDQVPPVPIAVDWLAVGHVDEVMGIYPYGGGWRIAVASTSMGTSLVSAAPKHAALFWHCRTAARTRDSACYGHGTVTTATSRSGATPARLTASGFTFNARPAGREWQWIRIYDGTGRGQVAHVSAVLDAHTIELDQIWNLPTPDRTRCAATEVRRFCDRIAAGLGMAAGGVPFWPASTFRRTDWFTLPTAGAKFVVVEDSLDWDPRRVGSASGAGGPFPAGVPALVTAGELASAVHNKAFLDKQVLVGTILDLIASTLAGLPGSPTVKRVPALYQVVAAVGSLEEGEAYVPGIVNFQVVQGLATAKIFAARPFGPSVGSADPFETKTNTELGATPTYVDDWDTYHVNLGEVHCGTNLLKSAAPEWWK